MHRYQIGSAIFLLFVGCFFAIEGQTLKLGKIVKPEPGFFPFWLGIGLIILSLALIFQSMRGRINTGAAQPLWKGIRWQKVIFLLAVLLLYSIFLERLGYILATFILMFFMFRAVEAQKWPIVILGSVVTSLFTYVLFRLWLQVQLPVGLWGI